MSVTTIIRVPKVNNFTIISNGYVNDDRISWKAKGILTCLLSKPDDWQVHPEHLKTVSKDGIKAVYSGLRELIEYGYMERHAYRDDKKRITRWEYIVIESPLNNCEKKSKVFVTPENSLPTQIRQEEKKKIKKGGLLNTDLNKKQKKTTADKAEPQPLSSSPEKYKTEHNTLVGLIPEPMRQPVIINLVDKYHRSHGFEHVADCIVYTNQRPQKEGNGTWQAYRGYLSKGLAGQYEGISGMYASANSKEDKKKSGRQEILDSIFKKKKILVLNDGKKYEIDEGFIPDFEYIDKNTGKKCKCTLIPSQVADIVMAGKATLE